MSEMWADFWKPAWWTSVVVAGLLINIASSYIKSWLDRTFTSTSTWWRNRSSRRIAKWDELVENLKTDPKAFQRALRKQAEHRFHTLTMAAFGLFLLVSATNLQINMSTVGVAAQLSLVAMAVFMFFIAQIEFSNASYLSRAIAEAEKNS